MSLPRFSVERPILTFMLTAMVVVLGSVALYSIKIDLLPEIELPTLSIRTEYEGASPEVVERRVTQIIEEIVSTVPGVSEVTSQSAEGMSEVGLTFVWGSDIDNAALEVRGKLEDELNELPDEVKRPQIRKFDVGSFPVVVLGISSDLDPVTLTTIVDEHLRNRFSRIPNVAQVDMWGEYTREIRIEVEPDRLRAFDISIGEIGDAIRGANIDLPAGSVTRGDREVTLRAPAEFTSLTEIAALAIKTNGDSSVTVGQVAKVVDTHERLSRLVRVNGHVGLRLAIRKQPAANTVDVARQVLEEAAEINRLYPHLTLVPVMNQGNFIERSIRNVAQSVLYGGILAVLVLLFFLVSPRSTLVLGLSIPISMVATFAVLKAGKFSLNLMSLGGLALGVGMMVDSSIVVLENVFRRRDELGETVLQAAVNGAQEVAPAIVASTITTSVVFLPLVFAQGVSGLLFRELAYVIVISLVASLLVSLTLLPVLASRFVEDNSSNSKLRMGWLYRISDRFTQRLVRVYGSMLHRALAHRWMTVGIAFGLTALSLALVPWLGSEFMPASDEGEVQVIGEMPVGTSLEVVDAQTQKIEAVVKRLVPESLATVVTVGASGRRPSDASRGQVQLSLPAVSERDRSNVKIAAELRRNLAGKIPGMTIRTRAPKGQFLLQRILKTDAGLLVEIRGFELKVLDALATEVARRIESVEGITDVDPGRREGVPQEEIVVDKARSADLGLTALDISTVLQSAVAGTRAGEYRTEGDSHEIRIQAKNARTMTTEQILDLAARNLAGELVPLRSVVRAKTGQGPLLIERADQQRIVRVEANVAGRDLGSVASEVNRILETIPTPPNYTLRVAGDFEEQEKAFNDLITSLILALALVYMVLASQYESFSDPLVVMLSVPVASVGVVVTLLVTSTTLNVQSYIGCIMLGGIVVNNAILLVDQIGQLRSQGMAVDEAVTEAGRRRLRPILMTTLTTVLGLFPLALGIGEGADAQAPLARAVIGGLVGSTPLTLVLIPAVYSVLNKKRTP